MNLGDYLAQEDNLHARQGNPSVKCNAVYKTRDSFNCYLTALQAIEIAGDLLQKAHLILDNDLQDAVVHMWNTGAGKQSLSFGLNKEVKHPRRKRRRQDGAPADDDETPAAPAPGEPKD